MINATSSVHSSSVGGEHSGNILTTAGTSTPPNVRTVSASLPPAVLPSLVIALASVVLAISTSAFSSDKHNTERLLLGQVGLLICASLLTVSQSTDTAHHDAALQHQDAAALDVLSVSVYCTILLNLICTALSRATWSAQYRGINNDIGSSSSSSSTRSRSRWWWHRCCISESSMHSVSLASIGPVAYSAVLVLVVLDDSSQVWEHHIMWRMLLVSYVVALLLIIIVKHMIMVRNSRRDVLVGIPMVGGSYYDKDAINGSSAAAAQPLPPPRPDRWYVWSPDDIAQWILSLPRNRQYASTSSQVVSQSLSWSSYAAMMQEEHVDGAALASVTVDALRSFGMPYGIASTIRREVDEELIGRYGTGPIRLLGTSGVAPPSEGFVDAEQWLDQIQRSSTLTQYAEQEDGTLDPDMSEKAQELFSGRFGLTLPQLKTESSSNIDAHDDGMRRLDVVDEERSNDAIDSGAATFASPLNEALLATMPPDVREVAARRPDLVRTLLLNRRNNDDNTLVDMDHDVEMPLLMETASTNATMQQAPRLLTQVQRAMMAKPSYAERYTGARAAAEISGVEVGAAVDDDQAAEEMPSTWDNDEGSDTVGLLRRRPYR